MKTQKFYWKSASKGNSKQFIKFLNQLRGNFPNKKLLIIVDNSSVHLNKRVQQYLARHKDVVLFRLPTYSPEYNPVEKVWWWIKPKIYGVFALGGGLKELLKRIRHFFWHYNEGTLPINMKQDLKPYKLIIDILAV